MREVFNHQEYTRVGFYKSVLDEAGIPNFIRNQYTNHLITSMPSALFFPSLCIVNDEEYDEAMQILGAIHDAPQSQAADWRCPKCNEEVPGNFDSCWQCGAVRADSSDNTNE